MLVSCSKGCHKRVLLAGVQRFLTSPCSLACCRCIVWLFTLALGCTSGLHLGGTATNYCDMQEPVLGAGLAWAVLGERWGAWGWVGAALILVSSLSAQIFGSSCAEK